ncbi:MAG TPA: right-handed parallel beta-helix repeat-containing protein, partial [Chthoniobacteraceae bacterium]
MNRQHRLRAPHQTQGHSSIEVLESRIAPATFVVLNLNDSGAGSLRDAIDQANTLGGPDTIVFHAGLHGTIALSSGQLRITDEVTIDGPGGNKIILDGLNQSRVFLIDDGTSTDRPATLSGLTIIDGNSTGDTAFTPAGGGIVSTESLTLKNCVISGNTSVTNTVDGNGGGVAVFSENASVNIVDSQITNNVGDTGGGLYLYAGKSITINGSKILNNHGRGFGGGGASVQSYVTVSSDIVVENTLFQGNTSETSGGGLSATHNQGGLTISGCKVIDNTAISSVGGGMAIVANGNVVVEKSSVTNNRSIDDGGGLFCSGSAPIEIVSSKVTGNQLSDAGQECY